MTTANPTARIDLDKLAAGLTAAGWDCHYSNEGVYGSGLYVVHRQNEGVLGTHVVSFTITPDGLVATHQGFQWTARVWHALDLIRTHTTEAPHE